MLIVQNAYGGQSERQLAVTRKRHSAFALKHGYAYRIFHEGAPAGWHPAWSKIPAWIRALESTKRNVLAVDTDGIVIGDEPLHEALGEFDLAMVKVHMGPYWWFNTGVVFIRNNPEVKAFLSTVFEAGPVESAETTAEQARINIMLRTSRLRVLALDNRYNCYSRTPCSDPIIKAFHGEPHDAVLAKLIAEAA